MPAMSEAKTPAKKGWPAWGIRIHPEVRKRVNAAASLAGISTEDWVHRVLCREIDADRSLSRGVATR